MWNSFSKSQRRENGGILARRGRIRPKALIGIALIGAVLVIGLWITDRSRPTSSPARPDSSRNLLEKRSPQITSQSIRKGTLSDQLVDTILSTMRRQFDPAHGGFGSDVKFPSGSSVELALAKFYVNQDPRMLEMVTTTLDAMAQSGFYDQIGGGFFRYSTDRQWRVPYFEKRNDDNAELLTNYLHAYQATGNLLYRRIAEGIIGYLNDVLSDQASGGFYAHQDAGMTREDDGDYYTWSVREVKKALPRDEARVMLRYFDVQPLGEMNENPAKNVLFVATTPEAIAHALDLPAEKVRVLLDRGKRHLLQARMKRNPPPVDQTLYVDRNALLISAYLQASQVLRDDQAKAFALKTLDVLLREAYRPGKGMDHVYSEGKARIPGLLSDQVQMASALLDAFEVTSELRYLEISKDLMDYAIDAMWDRQDGGFFDRQPQEDTLAALGQPIKDFEDDPTASTNAVAASVLDRLAYLTNHERYEQHALQTLQAFAGTAGGFGHPVAAYALAVHYHLNRSAQAVIIGEKSNPKTQRLWNSALTTYRPGKMVAVYDPRHVDLELLPPAVAGAVRAFGTEGEPRAYICDGFTCAPPTEDPSEVVSLIRYYGLGTQDNFTEFIQG